MRRGSVERLWRRANPVRRKRLFREMRLLRHIDPEPTFMAAPVDSRGSLPNQSARRFEMGGGAIQTARQTRESSPVTPRRRARDRHRREAGGRLDPRREIHLGTDDRVIHAVFRAEIADVAIRC
jgi:hypothetical protein